MKPSVCGSKEWRAKNEANIPNMINHATKRRLLATHCQKQKVPRIATNKTETP